MAYTAPTTRTTGELITASIWNVDVVDNISYFGGLQLAGTNLSALGASTDLAGEILYANYEVDATEYSSSSAGLTTIDTFSITTGITADLIVVKVKLFRKHSSTSQSATLVLAKSSGTGTLTTHQTSYLTLPNTAYSTPDTLLAVITGNNGSAFTVAIQTATTGGMTSYINGRIATWEAFAWQ